MKRSLNLWTLGAGLALIACSGWSAMSCRHGTMCRVKKTARRMCKSMCHVCDALRDML